MSFWYLFTILKACVINAAWLTRLVRADIERAVDHLERIRPADARVRGLEIGRVDVIVMVAMVER